MIEFEGPLPRKRTLERTSNADWRGPTCSNMEKGWGLYDQSQVLITFGGSADVRSLRVSPAGSMARSSSNVLATSAPGNKVPPR